MRCTLHVEGGTQGTKVVSQSINSRELLGCINAVMYVDAANSDQIGDPNQARMNEGLEPLMLF